MTANRNRAPSRPRPRHPYVGNVETPFAELMRLEKIDEETFRSIATPFAPGADLGPKRSYGAHVYAQAAWAASQTVDEGFLIHHVSGNFILAGELDVPFVYRVQIVRNGKSYCTRAVNVTQSEGKGICFTCICSFKLAEPSHIEDQEQMNLWQKYDVVLKGRRPLDFEEVPGMDLPPYWELLKSGHPNDMFPGLQCRKVDMAKHNQDKHPLDRRQLIFYRTIGDLPSEPNLHLAAHIYASDRNSLYIVSNHYDLGAHYTQMGSLCHTIIFHSPLEALQFGPSLRRSVELHDPTGRWFAFEGHGSRLGSGRGVFNLRLWNSEGTHVATAIQDGMMRFSKRIEATKEEKNLLEGIKKGWKMRSKI